MTYGDSPCIASTSSLKNVDLDSGTLTVSLGPVRGREERGGHSNGVVRVVGLAEAVAKKVPPVRLRAVGDQNLPHSEGRGGGNLNLLARLKRPVRVEVIGSSVGAECRAHC